MKEIWGDRMKHKRNHIIFPALLLLAICGQQDVFGLPAAAKMGNTQSDNPDIVLQLGHASEVRSAAFSPDGNFILSGARDNSMKLWNVASGKEIRTFHGHQGDVFSVAFSTDGRYALSSSLDKLVKLWDISTGNEIRSFDDHDHAVYGVAFSPDGKLALSGSWDKSAIIREIETGRVVHKLMHPDAVISVAFSPDGKYALTGSLDSRIRLWDVSSGNIIRTFSGHSGGINSVVFSNSGDLVVSGSRDKNIKLWETETGREIKTLQGHVGFVRSAAFSPDNARVISGCTSGNLLLWDIASGEIVRRLTGHDYVSVYGGTFHRGVYTVSFSPNGLYVLSGSEDSTLKLWDVASGENVRSLTGQSNVILSVAFSPDGIHTLSGSDDHTLMLWDLSNGRMMRTLRGHTYYVKTVAFSPNGKFALSGSDDSTLKLWDISTGREIRSFTGHTSWINSVTFSPDGKNALSGSWDKTMKLWDIATGREIRTFEGHTDHVESAVFSPDGHHVLSGSRDRSVRLWNTSTGKVIRTVGSHSVPAGRSTNWVHSVAFSPDNKFALSGSFHGSLKKWDVSSGSVILNNAAHDGGVSAVSFVHDGRHMLSGSFDNTIKLWDSSNGRLIRTFEGHSHGIHALDISPDENLIISGSRDGTTRIWDINSGEELVRMISSNDEWLSFTPDGYYFGSKGSFDGVHYVKGMRTYTFDQFDLQYNRPDIVLQRLGKASPELVFAYRSAWEKRLRRMGFDPANFEQQRSFNIPEIRLLSEIPPILQTRDRNFSFRIAAKDERFPLERLFVEVNGVPIYGVRGRDLSLSNSRTTEQEISLVLSQGRNIIRVSVLNRSGVESLAERFEVTYTPAQPQRPDLHIVAIGVSRFMQDEFNLTYADKDANDLVALMRDSGQRYANVHVQKFTNEQASSRNILQVKNELMKTGVDDHVVVFVASHGLLDDDLEYYIAMHDTDFENPSTGGLRYDLLDDILDGIPARNKLMLIDACHSGEVDREDSHLPVTTGTAAGSRLTSDERNATSSRAGSRSSGTTATPQGTGTASLGAGVTSRGFRMVEAQSSGIGLKNSFELMRELFADLRRHNGTVVISSASGEEFAFESPEWSNGVFTYSVLEGVRTGNADLNSDNRIMVSELRDYVSRRVQELTEGRQNPTSRTENLEYDFGMW